MAKKKTDKAADAAPVARPVYHTDGDTADKVHPIRVWQEGDVTHDYLHEHPRHREVYIGGLPYDHASTDADGVWVYRNDRKN